VRLATFNVLHGRTPADGAVEPDRLAAAVRELDADLLALQEMDRGQPRSHRADLTQLAAQAAGAVEGVFAPALAGLPGAWRRVVAHEEDGPLYGVALASRLPIESSRVVLLPHLPGAVPVLFPGRRRPELVRDEPRVALVARVRTGSGPLTVVSTHLSFIPGWNVVQLRSLMRALRSPDPLVLMGDLNMPPSTAVRSTGLRALALDATYPVDTPREQLDHVLVRGPVEAVTRGVARPLPVSDHRALQVDVEVRRLA
jgi:endonuclease/exonuclease/phosphatase family metal-dependent hydrolase